MRVLVIDNYDSFTYNLVQFIEEANLASEVKVVRNDAWSLEDVESYDPDAIVISPGPGTPEEAGISTETIERFGPSVPTLGVCLGHQCIATAFGGTIQSAERLLHGKTSDIFHRDLPVYDHLPDPFEATRYHSLIVDEEELPDELSVDAVSEKNEVMGLHHESYPVVGVQFHPESILTEDGRRLIKNFLEWAREPEELGESERPRPVEPDADADPA
jgi:anthranilate synthase/aminodeoxychorismate synthase-like glutamine amidotransferase